MDEEIIMYLIIAPFMGIPIGLLMMIVTTLYLNHSKRRARLFELGYSRQSKWYQGEKVDFFTANFAISHMVLIAWMMKRKMGWHMKKIMRTGVAMAPNLHIDKNYEKFLEEFPFFVRWEAIKMIFMSIGLIAMFIGYGMAHGWFF